MRNFLITLMLCALTLTASNVFADAYDESKRTERFGLSFYDGRPLYVVMFAFTRIDPNGDWAGANAQAHSIAYYRLKTGDVIGDFGFIDFEDGRRADRYYGDGQLVYERYFYSVIDANGLEVYTTREDYSSISHEWMRELLEEYPPPVYSSGDLAVETYDKILPNAQDWARRGILLAVALLVISTGLTKFRELTSGGSNISSKDEKKSDGAASPKAEKPKLKKKIDASEYLELDHESPYRLRTPRELREERAQQDREHTERQRVMTEEEALREAYISGDYWGKSFSDEVRASNRELYEAFDKMDPFTRRLLIQKFDEMSFTKEATLLKSYNKDVYGFADDNIGNPFEGDDEEDGEPPF